MPETIRQRIDELRHRLKTWFLVQGLARLGVWLVALILGDLLLDWLFEMDTTQRAVMLALMDWADSGIKSVVPMAK